jgi:hypothetical protein|tara:strand:- start:74 stop:1408 length:1335 start_codon:yes stop_codon:yes gene_type:complete
MKTIYLIFSFMIVFTNVNAQSENKDVTITSSGSGITLEEAKQSALRSATEQAFGAFISTKTEILNDQLVADQMASVSSGNIKSFEILNQDQLPDGRWGVTLKTIVSVDKLTSFVQAKGITVEVKGGMFAFNIKQQLLNEQGEIKAVAEMVGLLHESMQISFDYDIKSSDPKSLDAESKNWEIPLRVTATCNQNIDFCANYFKKTLSSLSLTSTEVETYKSLNKEVFPIKFSYTGKNITFYLRKERSINIVKSLLSNWDFYTRLFTVQSGLDESFGNGESKLFKITDIRNKTSVSYPGVGDVAGSFTWSDKRTLSQIEQMTGYAVKPRGVISNFKHGGYVVWEKDGHGLVAAVCDLEKRNWTNAKIACEALDINGYSDWHLPTKEELQYLYKNLHQVGIADFERRLYWSSTENDFNLAWKQNFSNGNQYRNYKDKASNVRAVRAF